MNTKNLPKIELHCHIDGSIRPSTIFELLQKENIKVAANTLNEFNRYVRAPKKCSSLIEYLDRFEYPNLVMQSKENLERITFEVMEDAAKENVKYIELRFAPLLHLKKGLTFDEVIESVLLGIKKAQAKYEIFGNLILCLMRHESIENSLSVVEQGRKFIERGVVAIDLAGNEHDFPPEIHKEAFDRAKEYGYHITVHAGETGKYENITKSIELLHAERIGHGVNAKDDLNTLNSVIDNSIALEMCPTSNIQTKAVDTYENHPSKMFLDKKVLVTLSTDNRTVSNVTLTDEFNTLSKYSNYSKADFKQVFINSNNASFASSEIKLKLKKFIDDYK
ncbi:adenosine deaminase [Helicovermis profundi]|uniref:Adenosine deaminase n=1 Tax=Helicovermis profundi TaxID=3065157 RepID=A0AAU9E547_9FIRM|nr:adenosine deaminase [Clostridia bacterium S502]